MPKADPSYAESPKVMRINGKAVARATCAAPWGGRGRPGEKGSVLIMVLWILALIAMLAGEYMAHNRGKANLAVNAVARFGRMSDVKSALELLRAVSFEPGSTLGKQGEWIELSPGKNRVFVKVEKGESAVNLNTAADNIIREKIRSMLGEDASIEADSITDAVLDWRDDNDLVRTNGAEADYYEGEGFGYTPSNGPFKALTELLMVKGVSRELFWGDPGQSLPDASGEDLEEKVSEKKRSDSKVKEEEAVEETDAPTSLSDAFSIYTDKTKLVKIIAECGEDCYEYLLVFLEKSGKGWRPMALHGATLMSSSEQEE